MDIVENIAYSPLFYRIRKEDYEDLAPVIEEKAFGKREHIFSDGYEGINFYVVVSGRLTSPYRLRFWQNGR